MKSLIYCKIAFLCCFLLSGCKSPSNIETQIIHIDPQKLSTKSFSDFYKIKEVIPLETNDFSVIQEVNNIIFSEDKIIMSASLLGDAFYIFDRKGKFIHKVDKRGNGPGEYGREIGMHVIDQVEPNNNLIMNKSPRLLYYNYHNWELVKEAPWIGGSIFT